MVIDFMSNMINAEKFHLYDKTDSGEEVHIFQPLRKVLLVNWL